MLILEILVGWCLLSVPAALVIGAALHRSAGGLRAVTVPVLDPAATGPARRTAGLIPVA